MATSRPRRASGRLAADAWHFPAFSELRLELSPAGKVEPRRGENAAEGQARLQCFSAPEVDRGRLCHLYELLLRPSSSGSLADAAAIAPPVVSLDPTGTMRRALDAAITSSDGRELWTLCEQLALAHHHRIAHTHTEYVCWWLALEPTAGETQELHEVLDVGGDPHQIVDLREGQPQRSGGTRGAAGAQHPGRRSSKRPRAAAPRLMKLEEGQDGEVSEDEMGDEAEEESEESEEMDEDEDEDRLAHLASRPLLDAEQRMWDADDDPFDAFRDFRTLQRMFTHPALPERARLRACRRLSWAIQSGAEELLLADGRVWSDIGPKLQPIISKEYRKVSEACARPGGVQQTAQRLARVGSAESPDIQEAAKDLLTAIDDWNHVLKALDELPIDEFDYEPDDNGDGPLEMAGRWIAGGSGPHRLRPH